MIGAIIGDVIGSVFEWNNHKSTEFELFTEKTTFTDDSVLTVAIADSILNKRSYVESLKEYAIKWPDRGYGGRFFSWMYSDNFEPYNSWGNGSGMRVSPVGFAFNDLNKVLLEAKKSAEVTHNHPEGIKGAQAITSAIFMARTGESKEKIKDYVESTFGYNLHETLDEIRPTYRFDVSCQGSAPQAIIAFLESKDFEDAIRLAISIGGDSDTIACMTGGIAQAFYKEIPEELLKKTRILLPERFIQIIDEFEEKYMAK